jgi:uncharacterized membrane protein YfcA
MMPLQYLLGAGAGTLVGFTLGLAGGGGSILAVPLMIYVVGVSDPHIAIGTSALAVAANAAFSLASHARARHVKWRCAGLFALAGVVGAVFGSSIGKHIDGQKLLAFFAMLMLVVSGLMLRSRREQGDASVALTSRNAPRLVAAGWGTGFLSGFFGIGGGFLVVPGLMVSTGMPILFAVGSSLVAVTAFGLTTASSYALSGLVDWSLAAVLVVGGALGSVLGAKLAKRISASKGGLNLVLAGLIAGVGMYMLYRSLGSIGL